MTRIACIACIALLLWGCAGTPANVVPVRDFELDRYLGVWHEVARLDHRFERGLEQVTARYSLRDDGTVRVLNRGYSPREGKWNEAEGRAKFAGDPGTGHLEVSFFGPFYASYVIFELDKSGVPVRICSRAQHVLSLVAFPVACDRRCGDAAIS